MLLLIAVSTTGCATDPRLTSSCDWVQPIMPSRQDVLTRQTKEQIAAHNEAGAKICGRKPIAVLSSMAPPPLLEKNTLCQGLSLAGHRRGTA
jgi:hypothetical protein